MDPITLALMGGTAIASIFGAANSAKAADKASQAQQKTAAENKALAEKYTGLSLGDLDTALGGALGTLDQGKSAASAYLDPYAAAGGSALKRLGDATGANGAAGSAQAAADFTTSPGYQFRLDQGVQAIDRSANARGGLYSGGTLKALTDYGQGVGSQEWGNYTAGLRDLANGGQNAATAQSGLTADVYGSKANALLGSGAARANVRAGGLNAITDANAQGGAAKAGGYINQANAWNGGISNLATLAGFGAGQARPATPRPMGF
jgi:hypothetical protein